jgi:iron complex outermembrane recepter protein
VTRSGWATRDGDNTPLPILHTFYDVNGWQWSEELQTTFQTERTTGVAGIYYFKQRSNDIATIELNPPPPGVQRDSDNNIVDNESWALFTQWTYNLTEALNATGGVRYTKDKKGSYPDQYDLASPTVKQVPVQWYRDTFSDTTMSASVNYRWNPEAMSYVSYSEGFKGGGWNSHFNSVLTPTQQAALHPFQPETAETWEIGSKFDLVGRTLRLNIAAFQSDYTDMQITYRGPAPNGVAPFVTNAGKASIKGGEVELTWLPVDGLSIDASIARLRSRIDRLDIAPEAVQPAALQVGNDLPYAPRWQTHLGTEYEFTAGSVTITPRVDISYQARTYFDATNTPEIAQLGGYTTYNGSVVVKPMSGSWRVTLGVNNAGNKVYRIAGNSSLSTGSGYAEVAYARPREYFATMSWTFQ